MAQKGAEEQRYEDLKNERNRQGYAPPDLIENYNDSEKVKSHPHDIPPSEEETQQKGDKKEDEDVPTVHVPFFSLFQYTTTKDQLLMAVGFFAAFLTGAANPLVIVFLGRMLDTFIEKQNPIYAECLNGSMPNFTGVPMPNLTQEFLDEFFRKCEEFSIAMLAVGASHLILSYIMVCCLNQVAENQAFRIRHTFMRAVMRQEIGWFDTNETGDFASRITTDLGRIQDGIGEKLGMAMYFYSTTIMCIVLALFYGWKLTLVILSVMPVLIVATSIIAKIQAKISGSELNSYGEAGAIAEEVLSSIRTVVAFGGERKEITRYEKSLISARKSGIRRGLVTSLGSALVWFCIYASYALAFWYGSKLVLDSRCGRGDYLPSTLVIVFFAVLTGAMFIGQTAPYMEALSVARGAAGKVFTIINRVPPIDSASELGERPRKLEGNITFRNVKFSYPSRPDVQIMNSLCLEAIPGETVALVGSSGCGKSTVIQLMQRFYDPLDGQVEIDGKDIRQLNIGWLRDNIGVVGQEPVLFDTTIAENIRYGSNNSTQQDVEKAAKEANAHNFIVSLPKKYETMVGERGTQLSGGQKQRIAIARALIKNPKILLLDEATSALDTESESVVQNALDEASIGRTTLVVAHRLSTIRNADKIIAIEQGQVKETGTHEELMKREGVYYHLVTAQQVEASDDNDNENDIINSNMIRDQTERQFSICSTTSKGSEVLGSLTSLPLKKQFDEEEEDKDASPSQIRLIKMTVTEWPYVMTGCISSLLMGLSIPIYGVIFGDILAALSAEREEAEAQTTFYSLLFLIMGILSGIACFLQIFMFTVAGERLTMRLRKMTFSTMITQEISWFDEPKNSTGTLCSKLSSDAANVQGATGTRMSTLCQALSTLVAAIILGLIYNYKIGLLVLSFIPLVLIATFLESRAASGQILGEKKAVEEATRIAVEAIENIRTVVSLHLESTFYKKYVTVLTDPHKRAKRKAHLRGLTFGLAQSVPEMAYSAVLYYGSYLIKHNELTYGDLFKVLEGVILGTMIIGQAVAFAPDYHKAKIAAVRIFKLLDRKSAINIFSSYGSKPETTSGRITFSDIIFKYPTRPEVKILRGLNLQVDPGQTVALVGSSGCGKSTCVQLLERFYDSEKGELKLDGINIKELNLNWLRSQIGIVSQEPILFGYSIAENIAYGDNSRHVPMDEIIEAARKANIHSFVDSLPAGYDTTVGDKGAQLSGGQKQRVAIARALVRNPKIILLDEATSALDTESEKVVQEALDKASEGRTCLVIAHRLSTIHNADAIVVINNGRVVERGTHHELLAKQGLYYKMYTIQNGALD